MKEMNEDDGGTERKKKYSRNHCWALHVDEINCVADVYSLCVYGTDGGG